MQMLMEGLRLFFEQIPFLIGYVTRGASFPKPLREEQERDCLKRLAKGDESARDCLIEHNLRLVAHVARKYIRSGQDMDDLISIGTIGLIKAVNTYDDQKGKPLVSYAARCIENEILMVLRSGKKRQNDISLLEPIGTDNEGNALTLMDVLGTQADEVMDTVEARIQLDHVRQVMTERLEEREAQVLAARYGLDGRPPMAQHEVAKRLHISRSYVSRIEKKPCISCRKQCRPISHNDGAQKGARQSSAGLPLGTWAALAFHILPVYFCGIPSYTCNANI